MQLGQTISDFVSNPFDPNNDGKTSLVELFAALGLVAVIAWTWKRIFLNTFLGTDD